MGEELRVLEPGKKKKRKVVTIPQVDGPVEPMDSSDEDDGVKEDDESEDDDDGDDGDSDSDLDPDGEEYDEGVEQEPLNSADDNSDEDPEDIFDTENVVVCQFEKITRSRNKFKIQLTNGIMKLNGADFVFQQASGVVEW